jgi:hypothetical protein
MMNQWISVQDKQPKSGEDVLVYWWDEPYEIHQIHLLTYWRKGDVMDESYEELKKLAEVGLTSGEEEWLLAPEDGFYIYEGNKERPWRKHADLITHWMPLPNPPNKFKGQLAGVQAD